jgi:hypothetical protein
MKAFELFQFRITENYGGLHHVDVFSTDKANATRIAESLCLKEMFRTDRRPRAIWFEVLDCIRIEGLGQLSEVGQVVKAATPSQSPKSDTENSKILYLKARLPQMNLE